jgi:hypothetical protein
VHRRADSAGVMWSSRLSDVRDIHAACGLRAVKKVGDKAYCEALRAKLCRLAFLQQDEYAFRDLLSFLLDVGQLERVKQIASCTTATSILAGFGIHRCSGCGGDPVFHKEKYGEKCKQCEGAGWMHEVDDGVVYFTHGMFGPTEPHPKGTGKWKLLW